MKYTLTFLMSVLFVLFNQFSYSHGGRTNAFGCHNDNIRGGYHCHGTVRKTAPATTVVREKPFDPGKTDIDVIAAYYFDDNKPGLAYDYSGRYRHLELPNNAKITKGKRGKSLSLKENQIGKWSGRGFRILAPSYFLESLRETITVSIYVKIPKNSDGGSLLAIKNTDISGNVDSKIELFSTSQGFVRFVGKNNRSFYQLVEKTNVHTNSWVHLVFSLSDSNKGTIYVNGAKKASRTFHKEWKILNDSARSQIEIGRGSVGLFDEVAVLSIPWNLAQVRLAKNNSLKNLLTLTNVSPREKLATTWANIKQIR